MEGWKAILQCLAVESTTEDKIIEMIHLYVKSNFQYIRPFDILVCALEKKKFKCAISIIKSEYLKHIENDLNWVLRSFDNYKYILSFLFEFGVKLPTKSIVLGWFSTTEKCKLAKRIEFLEKLKSGGNNARKAALTMLAITRFRRNEHMANCINMDVMRIIARMIYESGTTEWKVWKTIRRKSDRLQKKRKIKE